MSKMVGRRWSSVVIGVGLGAAKISTNAGSEEVKMCEDGLDSVESKDPEGEHEFTVDTGNAVVEKRTPIKEAYIRVEGEKKHVATAKISSINAGGTKGVNKYFITKTWTSMRAIKGRRPKYKLPRKRESVRALSACYL